MKNYYKDYNLNPKASTSSIILKLEKVIRTKIKTGANIENELTALKVLSSEYLRKIYDLKVQGKRIGTKPQLLLRNTFKSASTDIKQIPPDIFKEKCFLFEYTERIVIRTIGLDYLFSGLGYSPLGETLRPTGWRANNTAFISHFFFYFGIPLLLGALNPFLYWTIAPILAIKIIKEYKRAKLEYYQNKLNLRPL